jgi:hypothetical protein
VLQARGRGRSERDPRPSPAARPRPPRGTRWGRLQQGVAPWTGDDWTSQACCPCLPAWRRRPCCRCRRRWQPAGCPRHGAVTGLTPVARWLRPLFRMRYCRGTLGAVGVLFGAVSVKAWQAPSSVVIGARRGISILAATPDPPPPLLLCAAPLAQRHSVCTRGTNRRQFAACAAAHYALLPGVVPNRGTSASTSVERGV